MSDIHLSPSGPPETVLPPEPIELWDALASAADLDGDALRAATVAIVTRFPRSSTAWAAMGSIGRDPVERYAAYRVGYHRGLDSLRANGWRGSGYVRWRHESNRGVLACIDGLLGAATEIGEEDEIERLSIFLRQLDPDWPPTDAS